MECPGSITLAAGADRKSSIYADTGTVAHTLASHCLLHDEDAWEYMGTMIDGEYEIEVDKDMADAVQLYLCYLRDNDLIGTDQEFYVERSFHRPNIHPLFMGIADHTHIDRENRTVSIIDYKNGAGVVVEARGNVQLRYYASGAIDELDLWEDIERVRMTIVQPNAFHAFGPVRTDEISTDELHEWLYDKLVPAMHRAEQDEATKSGSWCTFCPNMDKKCPSLWSDFEELERLMAKGVAKLTAKEMARVLDLGANFNKQHKAVQAAALARAEKGTKIPGWKIVKAFGNRVFRDGAEKAAIKLFGDKAYTKPKLKSPAQIGQMPKGEGFSKRWAHAPDTGHKLVPASAAQPEQGPAQKSMFKPVGKGK